MRLLGGVGGSRGRPTSNEATGRTRGSLYPRTVAARTVRRGVPVDEAATGRERRSRAVAVEEATGWPRERGQPREMSLWA